MRSLVSNRYRMGIWLVVLGMTQACKSPEEIFTEEPVFKLSGTIDDSFFDLTGGKNGYYMYTSHEMDTVNVSTFTAELRKEGCTFCPGSLAIRLRNNQEGDQPADMSLASAPGSYFYRNLDSIVYRVSFQAIPSGQTSYEASWDFGDGTQSNELNPVHIYPGQGTYNVCLNIDYGNGCSNSICNEIVISEAYNCTTDFTYIDSGTTVQFTPDLQGTPPFTYSFDYGFGQDTSTTYNFPDTGIYKVCLYSIDSTGCESSICKNIRVSAAGPCITNFSYEVEPLARGTDLSLISIRWIDESGNSYRSEFQEQPASSYFRILESEEYLANEKGEKTRKLRVEFDCMLYNESTFRHLKGQGMIAVGHP